MRIAYVCTDPGIPTFGRKGASVHVQAVLTALTRRGDQIHLVTPRTGGHAPAELTDVCVHELPAPGRAGPAEREVAVQQLDAEAADVLDRLHRQGPLDLVYERYSLWGAAASAWARDAGVPHILEVNAPLIDEQARHRVLVDRDRAEAVAASAIRAATVVTCVSEPVRDWARGYASDPATVHTLPNGVDTTRITPAPADTRDDPSPFVVGFVGTLKPWHGVDTLVQALALLVADDPSYHCLLVGDGPQAADLRARADALGVTGRLAMTGAVDPAAVPQLLHCMQVAVAPYPSTTDFYFSPLKLYEYLAAGLPVVASRVGHLADLLDDGRLGVLVEPDEPRKLADAISALRHDPVRRRRLGRAARARAEQRHDWSAVVATALRLAGRA